MKIKEDKGRKQLVSDEDKGQHLTDNVDGHQAIGI